MNIGPLGSVTPLSSPRVNLATSKTPPGPVDRVDTGVDLAALLLETAQEAASLATKLPEHVEGQALVKLHPGLSEGEMRALAETYGGRVLERYDIPDCMKAQFGGDLVLVQLPDGMSTAQGIAVLEKNPLVIYAEPNEVLEATRTPDDLGSLWGMRQIQAPAAWDETIGSRNGPVVAVVDSGVDYRHPDLAANMWTNPGERANGRDDDNNGVVDDLYGYNAAANNGDPMDDHDHGTHVAGTIAGVGNNGTGVVGVNWEGRIMACKFLRSNGKGATSDAVESILYAAREGARIANHSWGSTGTWGNRALKDALASSPTLHVAAAGNDGQNLDEVPHYPGAFSLPNLITVAATDWSDRLASFSNYSANRVHLAAPGVSTYSTTPGGNYGHMSGTSMATPHVAGVAALIATKYPGASNQEIRDRLLGSADVLPQLYNRVETGGRLNAARALEDDSVAPAAVGGFRLARVNGGEVEMAWTASGDDGLEGRASGYELRYSGDPLTEANFDQASRMPTGLPSPSGQPDSRTGTLFPSDQPRTLHFGIKAYDNVGNRSPLSSLRAYVPASRIALDDDMDGWRNDWEGQNGWDRVSVEGRGKVWTDSPDGEYANGADASLLSPVLDLGSLRGANVTFDARYDLERGRDTVALEVTTNGTDWSRLETFTGESPWERHRIDLSSFDGQRIRLRFRLQSDSSVARDGFSLDRVVVAGR